MAIGGFGVIFFDLGETLVTRVPGAVRAAWVPGAQAALAQLAARGVRLWLISNTTGLSRAQVLDRLPTDFQFNQFRVRPGNPLLRDGAADSPDPLSVSGGGTSRHYQLHGKWLPAAFPSR